MLVGECLQYRRQMRSHQIMWHAQAHGAGDVRRFHRCDDLVVQVDQLAGLGQQSLAFRRQDVGVFAAYQQDLPDRFLQPLDALADRALRHVQPPCGDRHAIRIGHLQQRAQQGNVEIPHVIH
jgi:hypothetical protein